MPCLKIRYNIVCNCLYPIILKYRASFSNLNRVKNMISNNSKNDFVHEHSKSWYE